MLSDPEREALRELERQFTAALDAAPHHLNRKQFGASGTLMIATILFLGVIMLMAGSLARSSGKVSSTTCSPTGKSSTRGWN